MPTWIGRLSVVAFLCWIPFSPGLGAAGVSPPVEESGVSLRFARHGHPVIAENSHPLEALAARAVRVHEPYEDRTVEFEALPLAEVLDAAYSPTWRAEEEILFTCSDGYQPSIPVQRVLEHRAWLAFSRTDQTGFTIQKRESGEDRTVELGPYYVIWSNLDDARILQEADYGWPYQVEAIDLIRTRDRFGGMAPPPGSSSDVVAGFDEFRIHCSKCHQVNGEGGTIGPELNPAAGSGEYYERDFLRTWIDAPEEIRAKTRMPALNPQLPDRNRTIERIMDYLYAVAAVGKTENEK